MVNMLNLEQRFHFMFIKRVPLRTMVIPVDNLMTKCWS